MKGFTNIERSDYGDEGFVLMDTGCGCCSNYASGEQVTLEALAVVEANLRLQLDYVTAARAALSQPVGEEK